MDRPIDVIEDRRLNSRNRVREYISNLRIRLFNPRDRYIAPTQSTTVELFRFHSENDLHSSQNLSSHFDLPSPGFHSETDLTVQNFEFGNNLHNQNSTSEINLIDFEAQVEANMESFQPPGPDSSGHGQPLRAIEDGDPIRRGLAEAHERLQRLSADFQAVGLMADNMRADFANISARLDRQQNEIGESQRIATEAQAATSQLRADVLRHIEGVTTTTRNIFAAAHSQAQAQQSLRDEVLAQRQQVEQFQNVALRMNDFNGDINQINDSITNLRLRVEESHQQLREDVNACQNNMRALQNRSAVVGDVQPLANLDNLLSSHTNDILKSFIDFDTKSNDSIKRFVNTTDMLWQSLEKTQQNIDRFIFKVKLKLAKCNQTFLHKIEGMNWPQIKNEILNDYSVNSARDTLAQINTVKQKSGESLFEYANRCKNLLFDMNSFLGVNADPGMTTINDRSARKAFEDGLSDSNLRNFVKNIPTRNLQELIDITVERYERNLSAAPRQQLCNYCSKGPHKESECRKKQSDLANKNRSNQANRGNNNGSSNQNRSNTQNQNNRDNRGNNTNNNQNRNSNSGNSSNQSNFNRNNSGSFGQQNANNNSRNDNRGQSNNFNRNYNQNANNSGNQSFSTRIIENTTDVNPFAPNPYVQMQTSTAQQANPHTHSGN